MDQTIDFLASHKISMMKEGELRENVKSNSTVGASVGMLWLDVEGTQVRCNNFCLVGNNI